MQPNPEVVITAGGTKEPIDDVRYIGNFSSGRFGHALAQRYAQEGHSVTLLAPTSTMDRFGHIMGVEHVPFASAEDLRAALLGCQAADLILHSAAVSDYTPERVTGKISSDQEQLTINLVRTPKILSLLREHFGARTTLVGFKLLSGVTPDHLIDVAGKQLHTNSTDYCVANRLDDIEGGHDERLVHLVESNGESQEFGGKTKDVAKALYDAIAWTKG